MIFEVWREGYAATCERERATFYGNIEAITFEEAVSNLVDGWHDKERYFDRDRLTWWGCRFFDNEIDARKSFG